MEAPNRINRRSAMITAGVMAVIVYGSLYPFHFYDNPDRNGPFRALFATWNALSGRGDLLANFVLYLPLGFFCARGCRQRGLYSFLLATAVGMVLSTTMELLQFYDDGRFSEMSDIYLNTAGTICGAAAGILSRGIDIPRPMFQRRDFVCLLLLCWLGYRLFPYAPVIDLHKYWAAVRALALTSNISTVDIYRHAVTWLAVSVLLEALVGTTYARFVVIPLLGAVLFFRIVADEVFLSLPEVAGGVIGVLLWIFVLWRVQHRTIIIAGLFVGLVILQALAPFQFMDTGRSFGWMPFRGLLNNSNASGVAPFLEKIFTYGCLVWLLGRAGCSWLAATISGAILVFVLRLMQVYLPGRSAEITDVILLLSAAIAMKVMAEDPRSQRA